MDASARFSTAPPPEAVSIERAQGGSVLGLGAGCTPEALINTVREGLPYKAFARVQAFLDVPARQLGARLSISERTLARRRQRGRLTPEESDRLLRLARLAEIALVVFEEQQASARRWLTAPKNLLGGESPLERLDTEAGAREVEDMLYAIEFTAAA